MKMLHSIVAVVAIAVVACGALDQQKYAHITQEDLSLDLLTGNLFLNKSPVSQKELQEQLKKAYAVSFSATAHKEGVDALFGSASATAHEKGKPPVSVGPLLNILKIMDEIEIDPKRVRLNFFFQASEKPKVCNVIEVQQGGGVILNGEKVKLTDLSKKLLPDTPLSMECKTVDYRQVLAVLSAVGPSARITSLRCMDLINIEVEAKIYQVKADGTKDVFSAPMVTTKPGNTAVVRVVENNSGQRLYRPGQDEYHQEDLANLGVRLAVHPKWIGDYIRVSGVTILTKGTGRKEAFVEDGIPIYSYSSAKTVVPFSKVFPPGVDSLEFPVSDMNGKEAFCRLSVAIVDAHGMTLKDRALLKGE